jgi:hypothetical protein
MPRQSLDKWTCKLKTIEVSITKHKLKDIYDHMKKMHSKLVELHDKYKAKLDTILDELEYNENNNYHYKKYNWRKGNPTRFWLQNFDRWYLADANENDHEHIAKEVFMMHQIYCDFMTCDNYVTDWQEDTQEWNDCLYDVSRMSGLLKDSFALIKMYENCVFRQCKDEWFMKDKEWIAESERKAEHKTHEHIQLPSMTNREIVPEPYPCEPLRDDCAYCKQEWEDTKPRYEKAVQVWTSNKKDYDDFLQEEAKKLANQTQKQELRNKQQALKKKVEKNLCCKDCEFEAVDEDDYDEHFESAEHKRNLLFCKACNTQCSHERAFMIHNETTKHKKNVGLIDKITIFKCMKCDYQTNIKCNFEKHIVNVKHAE